MIDAMRGPLQMVDAMRGPRQMIDTIAALHHCRVSLLLQMRSNVDVRHCCCKINALQIRSGEVVKMLRSRWLHDKQSVFVSLSIAEYLFLTKLCWQGHFNTIC